MEVVDGMFAGESLGVKSHAGRCRSTSLVRGDTMMTPDYTHSGYAALGRVGLPGKALARDATRRLRFDGYAAGWLHSMVIHGRTSLRWIVGANVDNQKVFCPISVYNVDVLVSHDH